MLYGEEGSERPCVEQSNALASPSSWGRGVLQACCLIQSQRGRDGSSHRDSFLIRALVTMVDDKSASRHRTTLQSRPVSHGSEGTLRQDWPLNAFIKVQLCKGLPLIHCGQETIQPIKVELTPFIFPLKIKIKLT